uniref:Uncharacterized protein n=1 Tax=Tetranychus urticae TaxID=32264 RepID=T1K8Q0_TETUR
MTSLVVSCIQQLCKNNEYLLSLSSVFSCNIKSTHFPFMKMVASLDNIISFGFIRNTR